MNIEEILSEADKKKGDTFDPDFKLSKADIERIMKNPDIASKAELMAAAEKQGIDLEKASDKEIADLMKTKPGEIDGMGETSSEAWKIKFTQSFPVKAQIEGKTYYGLARPPSGIITWQGTEARKAARDAGIPVKLPVMSKGSGKDKIYKVERGAKAFDNFEDGDFDFKFDDSDSAKKKVVQAIEAAGAKVTSHKDFDKKGATTGTEKAISKMKFSDLIESSISEKEKDLIHVSGPLKTIGFWKDIAKSI